MRLTVVTLGENGVSEDDVLVHDETNPMLASLLARMPFPEFPVALGVLYCNSTQLSYEAAISQQQRAGTERSGSADLSKLLSSGETWTV
jgi:2-oxoglutarate ferredoxin oxidoreductase subunit beta